MRHQTVIAFAGVLAGASAASGQITYQSQTRIVAVTGDNGSAPDFEPFNESVSWTGIGCTSGRIGDASASHISSLGPDSIVFQLHAHENGGAGDPASCQLTVFFTAEAGTGFRLSGQRHLGSTDWYCCGYSIVQLAGPGISVAALPAMENPAQWISFDFSGVFPGGTYSLNVRPSARGTCAVGHPVGNDGDANGTLTITPRRCRADADGNGAIEPADVAFFVQTWFTGLSDGTLAGDFDGNGVVQPMDVAVFVQAWYSALVSGPC